MKLPCIEHLSEPDCPSLIPFARTRKHVVQRHILEMKDVSMEHYTLPLEAGTSIAKKVVDMDIAFLISLAFGLYVLYVIGLVFYRLYLSPLAKFPGYRVCAASEWYEFYCYIIKGGQWGNEVRRMHDRYGQCSSRGSFPLRWCRSLTNSDSMLPSRPHCANKSLGAVHPRSGILRPALCGDHGAQNQHVAQRKGRKWFRRYVSTILAHGFLHELMSSGLNMDLTKCRLAPSFGSARSSPYEEEGKHSLVSK